MVIPRKGEKVWLLAEVVEVTTEEYPRKIEVLICEQEGNYLINEKALRGSNRFQRYIFEENDRICWKDPSSGQVALGNFRSQHGDKAWVVLNDRNLGDMIVEVKDLERV